jgi:hypothetical protein
MAIKMLDLPTIHGDFPLKMVIYLQLMVDLPIIHGDFP